MSISQSSVKKTHYYESYRNKSLTQTWGLGVSRLQINIWKGWTNKESQWLVWRTGTVTCKSLLEKSKRSTSVTHHSKNMKSFWRGLWEAMIFSSSYCLCLSIVKWQDGVWCHLWPVWLSVQEYKLDASKKKEQWIRIH